MTAIGTDFVSKLVSGNFEGAGKLVSPKVSAKLTPAHFSDLWQSIVSAKGAFKRQIGASLEVGGEYSAAVVACEFGTKGEVLDLKVVLNQSGQVEGLFVVPHMEPAAPPSYVNPSQFKEQSLEIPSTPLKLPATLTFPTNVDRAPCVVLVHGSGPQDRDETIGPNKPFRDLAQGLATAGIAVLRYEKRTHLPDFPKESAASLTVKEETIDDAVAAVAFAKTLPQVDPKAVYVLGHSLGGMLIPRIAKRADAAGYIVAAGSVRPMEDLIVEQFEYMSSQAPPDSSTDAKLAKLKQRVARIKSPDLDASVPAAELLGIPAVYWLDLRGYDPAKAASEIKQPLLVMQGGRDYQVSESKDFELWKSALSDKGQPFANCTFKVYPQLNHLFMEGTGTQKSTPAEYMRPANVSSTVIDDIAAWIKKTRVQ